MRSLDYALIQQVSISFDTTNHNHVLFLFSYQLQCNDFRNLSEDNMWHRILGEILKRFFVTVNIYRHLGWNIFWNSINGVWNKMFWVENFLKINKQGGRVLETWEYSKKIILFLRSCDWCSPIVVAKCFFAFNSKELV